MNKKSTYTNQASKENFLKNITHTKYSRLKGEKVNFSKKINMQDGKRNEVPSETNEHPQANQIHTIVSYYQRSRSLNDR